MGSKYAGSSTQIESSVTKRKEPHGIWRGIGCLMMIIIPVISIAAGHETVNFILGQKWGIIPFQLLGNPRMPDIANKLDGLYIILKPITQMKNFYADAIASVLYMILISGLISVIYAATYNAVGPSRYGPTDAPPARKKITKKSR